MEDWGSPAFVAEKFREWYNQMYEKVEAPTNFRSREFAFLRFDNRTMFRHMGFTDIDDLRRYLRDNTPAHVYYSSAYYEKPQASMDKKGWLGADLVFDIDADHLDLKCQIDHDRWRCRECGREGRGKPPELCECGKATFITDTWLCEDCLQTTKYEAQKLLDILIEDLNFDPNTEVLCNFSGNRGYHVHVLSEKIRTLGQNERRELVDYILGIGLIPEYLGFSERMRGGDSNLTEQGWRGRSVRALYEFLLQLNQENIPNLKLRREEWDRILEEKETILDILLNKHPSNVTQIIKLSTLNRVMEEAVKLQAAQIDTVVTTDVHRLIRLPRTLHGKTGWQVQPIPLNRLPDYDPLKSAITLKGDELELYIKWAPRFRIGTHYYGPYEEEKVNLPLEAAIFVLCKKGGRITN
jgi:DNA primase small subunit